ncbi:MAG: hypothetical protein J1E41_06700, partial [Ruminococcus sp.]|nr:hypothetical protein [Ruminococcus sp.]
MKKLISLILSVLILCSVAVVTPAFAADDTYVKGSVIKVTFTADDISIPFTAMEGSLNFSTHVNLVEDSVEFAHIGDVEFNVNGNEILFNSTSLQNYDISSDKVIVSAEFNVVKNVTGLPIQAEISDVYYIDGAEFKELEGITLPYKLSANVDIISTPETTEPETSESTTAESTSVSETTTATESTETTSSTQNTTDSEETTTTTESTAPTTATETVQPTTEPVETTDPTAPSSTTTNPTEEPKPTQPTTAKPAPNVGPG